MPVSKRVADQTGEMYGVRFYCPGCKSMKVIHTGPAGNGPCWPFNGDYDHPTLSPSILCRGIRTDLSDAEIEAYQKEFPGPGTSDAAIASKYGLVCHSFVVNGRIQFLGDCTHALAGQTLDLPELTTHQEES